MTDNRSRRDMLRTLGTASVGGLSVVAGCTSGDKTTSDSERNQSPRTEPPVGADSGPTHDETPTTQAGTSSDPDAGTPCQGRPSLSTRPYAAFAPRKKFSGGRYYPQSESSNLDAVRSHTDTLGLSGKEFASKLGGFIFSIPDGSSFVFSHGFGNVVLGDFDRETAANQLSANADLFKSKGSMQGYDLYTDEYGSSLVAIGAGELFNVLYTGLRSGKKRLNHMLEIGRGDMLSYYHVDPEYWAVVKHLPQGVYTNVHHGPIGNPDGLPVNARGQTVLFDGDHDPATGRTVLRFERTVDDPVDFVRTYVEDNDRLWKQQFHDPEISAPSERTVVIDDRLDPAAIFES